MFDDVLAANANMCVVRVFVDGRWGHVLLACLMCSGRWDELSSHKNDASLSEHISVCRLMCNGGHLLLTSCISLHIYRPDECELINAAQGVGAVLAQQHLSSTSLGGASGTTVGVAARGALTGCLAAMTD